MQKNDLEALKMLQDWSKWLVTVDVAVIGVIGATTESDRWGEPVMANILITAATISFALSVVAATWLLLALPGIAQRLPPQEGDDIFMMGTMAGVGVRLVYLALAEHVAFLLGVLLLASTFVARLSGVGGAVIASFVVILVIIVILAAIRRGASLRVS